MLPGPAVNLRTCAVLASSRYRLEQLVSSEQPVLVRVIPGVRPDTHEAVATGQLGSKFGLPIPAARAAITRLRHSDKLRVDG
jgi:diaminopimelate decarboxylase